MTNLVQKQRSLYKQSALRISGAAVLILSLTGCDDGGMFPLRRDSVATDGGSLNEQTIEVTSDSLLQDHEGFIEAPEIFQVIDSGLWDGRPSFGGVWVAHPSVEAPEHVVIRNEENGRVLTGALFRREREYIGAVFQVSSEAAEALGIIAGATTNLSVTALRHTEIEDDTEASTR